VYNLSTLLALVGCAAIVVLVRLPFMGSEIDDAIITFRYADNLGAGNGFCFNPGERVLGTTTLLYTLVLAAFRAIGISPFTAARFLNVAFDVAAIPILFLLGTRVVGRSVGLAAALVFATSGMNARVAGSGMETSLLTCLFFLTILFHSCDATLWCGISGGLVALTRPDGVAVIAGVLLVRLLQKREYWRVLVGVAAVGIPALIAQYAYFHTFISQSAVAKAFMSEYIEADSRIEILKRFLRLDSLEGWVGIVLTVPVTRALWKTRNSTLCIPAALLAYGSVFLVYGLQMFIRYYAPVDILYALFLLFGVGVICGIGTGSKESEEEGGRIVRDRLRRAGFLGFTVFIVCVNMAGIPGHIDAAWLFHRRLDSARISVGQWLGQTGESDWRVYVTDIGYIGFLSGKYIVDPVGLIAPWVIDRYEKQRELGLSFIEDLRPEVCIFSAASELYLARFATEWFCDSYIDTYRWRPGLDFRDPLGLLKNEWVVYFRRDLVETERADVYVSPIATYALYREQIGRNDLVGAIRSATMTCRTSPRYALTMGVLQWLVSHQRARGAWPEAAAGCQAALTVEDLHGDFRRTFLTNLGVCLFMMGQEDAAKRCWKDALKDDPNFQAPLANLAALAGRDTGNLVWVAIPLP